MNCFLCDSPKKYKCSKCRIPYCSASCYKEHKDKCPGSVPSLQSNNSLKVQEQPLVKTDYLSDQELRVPLEKLEKLRTDPKLLELLKSTKLRERLTSIDNSKQRITNVQQSMQDQQFEAFFQHTMNILQMQNRQQ